jgi:hypothetical protein
LGSQFEESIEERNLEFSIVLKDLRKSTLIPRQAISH